MTSILNSIKNHSIKEKVDSTNKADYWENKIWPMCVEKAKSMIENVLRDPYDTAPLTLRKYKVR